jgi:ACS family tartrate transporter-like MFS transporter
MSDVTRTITAADTAFSPASDRELARSTMRRVNRRLLPLLFALYVVNWMDRENVGFAAIQMNRDLAFSATAFGLGAGIFFVGYTLFDIPSNLVLARVGARRWIARIMITWGLVASGFMFVRTPLQFYVMRFLLGVAEAGFLPGIIYYMSHWFPVAHRARAMSRFLIATPIAGVIGGPLSGVLLGLEGRLGLHGWQWLFLVEGIPSIVLGVAVLWLLTDRVEEAGWLSDDQRRWLDREMRDEDASPTAIHGLGALRAMTHPIVWLLALPYFLISIATYGYGFWAPTIIHDTLKTSALSTGVIIGGIALVAAATQLAVGLSSDRTGERPLHAATLCGVSTVGFTCAALLPMPGTRVIALAVAYISARSFAVPFWCMPSMVLRGAAAATGIAFISSLVAVSGMVAPYSIGAIKDATGGTTIAFIVLAIVTTLAAGFALAISRRPGFAPARNKNRSSTTGFPPVGADDF